MTENIKHLLLWILISFLGINSVHAQYTTKGVGMWEDRSSWYRLPSSVNDPFDGILSNGSYKVEGVITRNGNILQNVDLTIQGTLNVKGSFVNNRGKLVVSSGAILRIYGDFSMISDVEIKHGGVMIVYGNISVNGGKIDLKGDVISGDNFKINNSVGTLFNEGNLIVGGNFIYTSGKFNILGRSFLTHSNLYILDLNALVKTPPWNNDVCNLDKSVCYYGDYKDLLSHELRNLKLLLFVNEVFSGLGCRMTILKNPENQSICTGNNSAFEVKEKGASAYQWQVSNGENWEDLPNNSYYSNVTTDSLVITNASYAMNQLRYRCILKSSSCRIHTFSAVLNISPKIAPVIASVNSNYKCGTGDVELSVVPSAGIANWYSQLKGGNVLTVGNTYIPNLTQTTTYYVDATNDGCTTSVRVPVTAEIRPFPEKAGNIEGTSVVCQNTVKSYSIRKINLAKSYQWSYSGTGITLVNKDTIVELHFYETATSGSLVVAGVNDCGPGISSEAFAIEVNPIPQISFTGTTSICDGQSSKVTAFGGASYLWNTGDTINEIIAKSSVNTKYTVIAGNSFGCHDTADFYLTVNPSPEAVINGVDTICEGQNVILTASGGSNYNWNNGATTSEITVHPSRTSTYNVVAENTYGCKDTAEFTLVVHDRPQGSISGDSSVCEGKSAVLKATGGIKYYWNNGETIPERTVQPSTTTSYNVVVENTYGCKDTADFAVTVNAWPRGYISGDTSVCQGHSTVLTASGGTTYLWSTGSGTSEITVSPTVQSAYSVIVSSEFGCADTAQINVSVHPNPQAEISGKDTIYKGQTTILTASGGTGYLWSGGQTTAEITVQPVLSSTFSVVVNNAFGCSDTASMTVIVNPKPTGSIVGLTTICQGNSTTLTAKGGSIYVWNTGATTEQITVNPVSTTSYSVIVKNVEGYSDTVSVTVKVNPKPVISISGEKNICKGQSSLLTANGAETYLWNNKETTSSITVRPGSNSTYSVTGTDSLGCSNSSSITIQVRIGLNAVITGNSMISPGQSTTLIANGGSGFLWSTGDSTSSITVAPEVTTTYWAYLTNEEGCADTAWVTVYLTDTPVEIMNDNFEQAIIIPTPSKWNTLLSQYTTFGATSDGSRVSCTGKRPQNNVWFRFKAIARTVSVILDTDGSFGTIRNPLLTLYDDSRNELVCQATISQSFAKVSFSNLQINRWYYIAVDNSSGMAGSFTLSTNNNVNPGRIFYVIKDGDWNTDIWSFNPNATESCGLIPTENDVVYIRNKHVSVTQTQKAYSVYLSMNSQTSLTVSPGAKLDLVRRMYIVND